MSSRAARAWRLPAAERVLGRPTVVALICAAVNPVVGDGLGKGMVGTISDVPFSSGGIAMLIGIAAVVMAIILLVVKVIVTALLGTDPEAGGRYGRLVSARKRSPTP